MNSDVAGGSDSSGYLNEARLLADGRISEPVEVLFRLGLPVSERDVFIPLGFREGARPGTMVPTYPPGLPLHMALAGIVAGWDRAPFLVGPLAAIASLVLIYAVGRELQLPRGLAAAGSVALAACPIFFGMAIQPMSDVPATAWVLAAVYFALRSRRRPEWAFAAGAALGVAVLVRPMNLLGAVAIFFALPPRRDAVVRVAAGGALFAAFFFVYNQAAFGSATSTGYGRALTRNVSVANFLPQVENFSHWLPVLLTPLVPLGWAAAGFDRRIPRRDRALLLAWFGAFLAFFCFNEVHTDWWSVRYLLPGIPAMILAALLVARDLPLSRTWRRVAGFVVLAMIAGVGAFHIRRFDVFSIHRAEAVYRDASRGAARLVPAGFPIVAMQMSGAVKYYAGRPIVRWDLLDPSRFTRLRSAVEDRGMLWHALVREWEVADFLSRTPGPWGVVARWADVTLFRLERRSEVSPPISSPARETARAPSRTSTRAAAGPVGASSTARARWAEG